MKANRYTITVVDNETDKTVLELKGTNLEYKVSSSSDKAVLTLKSDVSLAAPTEKTEVNVYDLDEDFLDSLIPESEEDTVELGKCYFGHNWKSATGLFDTYEYCDVCNARKDETQE